MIVIVDAIRRAYYLVLVCDKYGAVSYRLIYRFLLSLT